MKISPIRWPTVLALSILLTACVSGGMPPGAPHLSATECRDLTALKSNAPPTHARNMSELSALRKAGYDPSPFFDPYYPDDLQQAQRLVDHWYASECRPT
ncbi:hypothetical protein AWB79_01093 [Caballeronia hypogeia]|uniref:Lipoprotein n=1 Tax=Caballeronia hypogeia TaxID=1777140 RepID=A0A157ZL38_9BURK|nr:DUF4148 domain-containing protein [Caballeronia hypogeia]SAK46215.1 hypothetical protein AWB79_01093 [Caballeronia hypogeia]